ncbi:MAG TPA: M48 family metallopeptidase [Fimbriimonadaceae bacterium]|nr:M48 family metallopeptidase [Fimbriimonadaceae bacterium]HRJ32443.1 M48 family metallopeptidase [Fimbriimonadaceae bacterium]
MSSPGPPQRSTPQRPELNFGRTLRRTLPDQIKRNRRGSLIYAGLLVILLSALGTTLVGMYAPQHWVWGAAGSVVLGILAALIATQAGPGLILAVSQARPAEGLQRQVLENVTEEMAIAAGIPMPQVYVIDDSALNAFATGRDPKSGVVVVTSGLLDRLDRDELQGVVAHEIAHIRNYDIRFMATIGIVAGLIPLLADFMLRSVFWGGGRRRSSDSNNQAALVFMAVGLVLAILAPIFAKLLEMAVSRQREYLADATAADLTRYPEGLARALEKIAMDSEPLEVANRATAHLYIIDPLRKLDESSRNLFSTHPPLRDRVRRLRNLMGSPSDLV